MRRLLCLGLWSVLLGLARPMPARAWEAHVQPPGADAWLQPWDGEHRQIAYAALLLAGGTPYADLAHTPLNGSAASRLTGNARGECAPDPASGDRPDGVRRTADGGFCLDDLSATFARFATDGPERVFLGERLRDATTGDDTATILEERYLPETDHFSELPDSNYNLADWLMKASYCPPDPSITDQFAPLSVLGALTGNTQQGCHTYEMWLGAACNSTHFGDAAQGSWQRYHTIATNLATRVATLRQALAASLEDRPELAAYLEEAEREALTYEGIAQHFLADRWSAGHAWNRWGSPNPSDWHAANIASPLGDVPVPGFIQNALSGAMAGLVVHGAQSLLRMPLPACAPALVVNDPFGDLHLLTAAELFAHEYSPGTPADRFAECTAFATRDCGAEVIGLQTIHVAYPGRAGAFPLIGDHRFVDVLRGSYALQDTEYGMSLPMPLPTQIGDPALDSWQRDHLLDCAARSYGEVFRAFGANDDGTYGTRHAQLADGLGGPISGDPTCSGFYETNASILQTLTALDLIDLRGVARSDLVMYDLAGQGYVPLVGAAVAPIVREELVALVANMALEAAGDPDGTSVARFPPPLFGVLDPFPGTISATAEPPALEGLPATDSQEIGRSKRYLYGAFQRSHADYWCARTTLGPDRGHLRGDAPLDALDGDNAMSIEDLRRPAYDAVPESDRERVDGTVDLCKRLLYRARVRSVAARYDCSTGTSCTTERAPYEDFEPVCGLLGVDADADTGDERQGIDAGYAPVYQSEAAGDLPIAARALELDPDSHYPKTIDNYCESVPAVTNAVVPMAGGDATTRYLESNYLPTQSDLEAKPDWVPTIYLQDTTPIWIEGVNFGWTGQILLVQRDGPRRFEFTWDGDEPGPPDLDTAINENDFWFDLGHGTGTGMDTIAIRAAALESGTYDVTITNTTDSNHERESEPVVLVLHCGTSDEIGAPPPWIANRTMTWGWVVAGPSGCGCSDPYSLFWRQKDPADYHQDRMGCEVCAGAFESCNLDWSDCTGSNPANACIQAYFGGQFCEYTDDQHPNQTQCATCAKCYE